MPLSFFIFPMWPQGINLLSLLVTSVCFIVHCSRTNGQAKLLGDQGPGSGPKNSGDIDSCIQCLFTFEAPPVPSPCELQSLTPHTKPAGPTFGFLLFHHPGYSPLLFSWRKISPLLLETHTSGQSPGKPLLPVSALRSISSSQSASYDALQHVPLV